MNKPLRLTTIRVEPEQPKAGQPVVITLNALGGDGSEKFYRLAVKRGDLWQDVSEFNSSASMSWTPPGKGEYILGFFAKNASSMRDYDSFRYRPIVVE